jgi:hypothetical protein
MLEVKIQRMAFAQNKKGRKRSRKRAKRRLALADKLEREKKTPAEFITMLRHMAATTIRSALRKKRRRKDPTLST